MRAIDDILADARFATMAAPGGSCVACDDISGVDTDDQATPLCEACAHRVARSLGEDALTLTSELRRYKDREASIIEACERVADGGQYRADIVSAIQRLRHGRDEACAERDQHAAELTRLRAERVAALDRGYMGPRCAICSAPATCGSMHDDQRCDDCCAHGGACAELREVREAREA